MKWYMIYNERTDEFICEILETSELCAEKEAHRLFPEIKDGMYAICNDDF